MLLEDLLAYYNKLERPVANESEAVVLTFGLTLQQIIDVVSHLAFEKISNTINILHFVLKPIQVFPKGSLCVMN